MCPDFRRGAEAVAQAKIDAEKRRASGGNFKPFAPSIFWKEDGEEKYVLFLNEMDSIPTLDLIGYIPQERKRADDTRYTTYETVIARTDPAIGEAKDPMAEEWEAKPKVTCIAVAVELEPLLEKGPNGRMRPVGFEVKTTEFERRVRDSDGELTDDTETVQSPVIGFVSQSPHNFFNVLTSYDANEAPIEQTPMKITKVGKGNSLVYQLKDYPDQTVDLSGLVDYIDGVSYVGEDLDDLLDVIDPLIENGDDAAAAIAIGDFLLNKRLNELEDRDRYDSIFATITESLDKWGKKGGTSKPTGRRERPQRRSQRRDAGDSESSDSVTPEDNAQEPAEDTKEEAPRRARRERSASAPVEDPVEEQSAESKAAKEKVERLRVRANKRKAAAA
jgi:hypothetical protein